MLTYIENPKESTKKLLKLKVSLASLLDIRYKCNILTMNNWKVKFTFKNNKFTDYLYKLKDGTILQSGPKGKWRFMISNFKELPILYKLFI